MTPACLIIDDPRLVPRYGFLHFEKLLDKMEKHNFFSEVAFIPINWRFNSDKTIRLFENHQHRFGICVHGNDHLGNEFGGTNYQYLTEIAETALYRMEKFKERTGLNYDKVMVFPQGKFSSISIRVLEKAGYYAACNSSIRSIDKGSPPDSELAKPYTDHYGLPLFLRRYPSDREGILQDFKNGRPIILVEHHSAFKKDELYECIDWVNSLGSMKWCSLSEVVEQYCPECTVIPTCKLSSSLTVKSIARRIACEIRDNCITPLTK